MSFLDLPWLWDRLDGDAVPATFTAVKWNRGPVAFYAERVSFLGVHHTTWVFCWADDWSVAFHLPARVTRWLERRLGVVWP